jgi:FkbH-like protein
MIDFNTLKKNSLKKDLTGCKIIKLAVVSDSSTQFIVDAIKGYGVQINLNFQIFETDHNQIDLQINDYSSDLYSYDPSFILIIPTVQKLLKEFFNTEMPNRADFAKKYLTTISRYYSIIQSKLPAKVIFTNFLELPDIIFSNYANKNSSSFLFQLRTINLGLMELGQLHSNLFINDICAVGANFGNERAIDQRMHIHADMPYSVDFLPLFAKNITDIISSLLGHLTKCIVLDLDNTLWGGVVADEGIENIEIGDLGIGKAFSEFQTWLKELKNRGIILTVCSKNTEAFAKEPFFNHPDMVLKFSDFAVFVANWESKVDNIHFIQNILNISFDSIVFLDDNPFERNMVKSQIPEIAVPELPEDPVEYVQTLSGLNLFETASFTQEDVSRNLQYQEEAQRAIVKSQFTNEDEYLSELMMISKVTPFESFTIPRISQLTQRSNQFNLRTIRYTPEEITRIAKSEDYLTLCFSLKDKFGDYGLISCIVLKKCSDNLFIDTWILSCRVLKRGMEQFILNQIVAAARKCGIKQIKGEYIPTPKNVMVKNLYATLGFISYNDSWILDVGTYTNLNTHIKNG